MITIGIATRGKDIYYKTITWLLEYSMYPEQIQVYIQPSPYSAAYGQENLFKETAKNNSTHLLVIDADVEPPRGCVEKLYAHNKDVVVAPIWFHDHINRDTHLNISYTGGIDLDARVRTPKESGLEEIKAAAFGVMMVSRRVIDEFMRRGESFTEWSQLIDPVYKKAFSDNVFFAKLRAFGFKAYVDWDCKGSVHHTNVPLCDETINKIKNG
jgi:hypothetical protein